MAKKSKPAANTAPVAAPPLVIDPFGPTKQQKIKKSKVVGSTFLLSDGTKLTITPKLSDVRRAEGQYNHQGQPLYFVTLGHTITTNAPKRLHKKIPKPKRTKKR